MKRFEQELAAIKTYIAFLEKAEQVKRLFDEGKLVLPEFLTKFFGADPHHTFQDGDGI